MFQKKENISQLEEKLRPKLENKQISYGYLDKNFSQMPGNYYTLDLSTQDPIAQLAGARTFLSGIQYSIGLEKTLGKDAEDVEIYFIRTPDNTFTGNEFRWKHFAYGQVIAIKNSMKESVVFPELRPNGCTMSVYRLNELPKNFLQNRAILKNKLKRGDLSVKVGRDTIPIEKIGTEHGNHFNLVLEDTEGSHYLIIHTSEDEVKTRTINYKEKVKGRVTGSQALSYKGLLGFLNEDTLFEPDTFLGKAPILIGKGADRLVEEAKRIGEFAAAKEDLIASEMFGVNSDKDLLYRSEHQNLIRRKNNGVDNEITMKLGAVIFDKENPIHPLTLNRNLPVSFYGGLPSLTPTIVNKYPHLKEASGFWNDKRLYNINTSAHGAGRTTNVKGDLTFYVLGGTINYDFVGNGNGASPGFIMENTNNLAIEFRGLEVQNTIEKYGLGRKLFDTRIVKEIK